METQNEWKKFEDEMPKLNQKVEIKFYDGEILEANFSIKKESYGMSRFYFSLIDPKGALVNLEKSIGWRKITKKEPDFSKLSEGDFVLFKYCVSTEWFPLEKVTGFVHFLGGDTIIIRREKLSKDPSLCTYDKSLVKEITRINIEEKEFEKI